MKNKKLAKLLKTIFLILLPFLLLLPSFLITFMLDFIAREFGDYQDEQMYLQTEVKVPRAVGFYVSAPVQGVFFCAADHISFQLHTFSYFSPNYQEQKLYKLCRVV